MKPLAGLASKQSFLGQVYDGFLLDVFKHGGRILFVEKNLWLAMGFFADVTISSRRLVRVLKMTSFDFRESSIIEGAVFQDSSYIFRYSFVESHYISAFLLRLGRR